VRVQDPMHGPGLAVCRGAGGEIICGAQSIGKDNVLERYTAHQLTVDGEERGDAENKDAQVIEQDVSTTPRHLPSCLFIMHFLIFFRRGLPALCVAPGLLDMQPPLTLRRS
jgi:hypothetical protein